MTYFFKNGNSYRVSSDSADISQSLPEGNYVVKNNPFTGFYLEPTEEFKLPSKIYGDCLRYSDRILETFRQRGKNTGVLLVGEKGSGKTLLMRHVAMTAKIPVIIINEPYHGDAFFTFLTSIIQPCIVLFDEFEKVYIENQSSVLTLLDGTYQSNKLFIISSNDKWNLETNMQNRPGRIFYMIEYRGLDESFIREYCEEQLYDKTKIDAIVNVSDMFTSFNFDMLTCMVEEINRYGESPEEAIKILNVKPEYGAPKTYAPSALLGNHRVVTKNFDRKLIALNPYTNNTAVNIKFQYDTNQDDKIIEEIEDTSQEDDVSNFIKLLDKNQVQLGHESDEESVEYDTIRLLLTPGNILTNLGKIVTYDLDENCIVTLNTK